MKIEWKAEYNLGISIIDDQHKHFVEILNSLYEAILQGKDREQLGSIFADIDAYATLHFETEEKYFDEFHYGDAEEHKAKHRSFKEKIKEFKDAYEHGELEISLSLIDFLEDWLILHLANIDKKYVPCFKEHGL